MWWALALTAGAQEPAPAPATGLTIQQIEGDWYVTSQVNGKEAVAWSCKGPPVTFHFGEEVLTVTTTEPLGAAIRSTAARGDALVLTTTLEACTGTKDMTFRWADAIKKIAEIGRCEGTPRTVRAVRDLASGVPVMRQCCDPSGKAIKFVGSEEPCPAGSEGTKPTPLER